MARTTAPDAAGRWRRGRLLPSLLPLSLLTNPFEWVVGLVSIILGIGVMVTEIFGLHAFTRTQVDLPLAVALGWGTLMFLGGALCVHSLTWHHRRPSLYTALESASLHVLGAAWTVFGISPFFINNAVYSTVIVGGLLALACLMRVHAIGVATRVTEEATAIHKEVR